MACWAVVFGVADAAFDLASKYESGKENGGNLSA